jgi:hypothetical protein
VPAKTFAQDDIRENRIVDLFNLVRPPDRSRHGVDAILPIDGHEIPFELKSVTRAGGSVSTVRDLGPGHIEKWKQKHWIVGFYDGTTLLNCRYGSPDDMAPWIAEKWEYIRVDFEMAQLIPALVTEGIMTRIIGEKDTYTLRDAKKLQKNQYSAAEYKAKMDSENGYTPGRMLDIFKERIKYVIERGATLNNPHIPADYFKSWTVISEDYAVTIRSLVRSWLSKMPPQRLARGDMP